MDYYNSDPDCINDLLFRFPQLKNKELKVLEPCAGAGILADRFELLTKIKVDKYDIEPHSDNVIKQDYMKLNCKNQYDVIITNLPYLMSSAAYPIGFTQLLNKTLRDIKPNGYVCNLQKLAQLESKKRYEEIYSKFVPQIIYLYSNRIKCTKDNKEVNTTIPYCWVIWQKDEKGFYSNKETKFEWIYK